MRNVAIEMSVSLSFTYEELAFTAMSVFKMYVNYLCHAMVRAVRSLLHIQGYKPPPRHAVLATYFT